MNYQAWLNRVEQWLYVHIGLGFEDLRREHDYEAMYRAQLAPRVAAFKMLRAEGYGRFR